MVAAIEISDLKKTYRTLRGPVQALRGLNLEVRQGEILGYVGVNGAGKSTSIKILLGLVQSSAGKARVMGHPAGSRLARSSIGYLPEVANYHEFMTADELLRVHASLADVPASKLARRCDEALQAVGLSARRGSRISEFSKGMKQRFGIAQALVGDPPLLILDELTSGLDPFAQKDLRDILLRLKDRNITVFFSSHHMNEVEALCDRAAIIHRGKLRASGTIAELTEQKERVEISFEVPAGVAFDDCAAGRHQVTVSRTEADAWAARALAAGCSLHSLSTVRVSLEEVFHDVTQRADAEELGS